MSKKTPESDLEIVSYGLGRQMADQLKGNGLVGLDSDYVQMGVKDVLENIDAPVTQQAIQKAWMAFSRQMEEQKKEAAKKTLEIGQQFLVENATREGVFETETGLQYEVLVAGDGELPTADSTVKTHYHGTFIDGQVFDSSVERGQPAEFPVRGVIAGWTEALQKMPVGSKWRLFVPSHLAYGEQGAGGSIPPNTTLVFDVELIDIVS